MTTQPPTLSYDPAQPNNVRQVAVNQKAIIFCILGSIGATLASFAMPDEMQIAVGLLQLCISIASAVFIFRLAFNLYSTAVAIILGILGLLPLIGLIVLLVINAKATAYLRQNGIQVGLLGAKPIPSA